MPPSSIGKRFSGLLVTGFVVTGGLAGVSPAAAIGERSASEEAVTVEKAERKVAETKTLEKEVVEKKVAVAAVRVSGVVTSARSKVAVAGASVTLTDVDGRVAVAKTDAKGAWSFASSEAVQLAPGALTVAVKAPGFLAKEQVVSVVSGEALALDAVELSPSIRSLTGSVVDARSKVAVAGASVTLTDVDGRVAVAKTDAKGAWSFAGSEAAELAVGPLTVAVKAERFVGIERSVEAQAEGTAVALTLQATVADSISGTITDAKTKAALVGVEVSLTDAAGEIHAVKTDARGDWTVASDADRSLAYGPATMTVKLRGYETATVSANIDASALQDVDTALNFLATSVSGLVADTETGLPLKDAKVIVTDSAGTAIEATTDEMGMWQVDMTREAIWAKGPMQALVTAERFASTATSFETTIGTSAVVDQKATFGKHQIEGVVVDGEQAPISGVEVQLVDSAGTVFAVTSGADGSFVIADDYRKLMAAGDVTITAKTAGFEVQVLGVSVDSSNLKIDDLKVQMVTAATLGAQPDKLAFTGFSSGLLAGFGTVLMLAGTAFLTLRRRIGLSS